LFVFLGGGGWWWWGSVVVVVVVVLTGVQQYFFSGTERKRVLTLPKFLFFKIRMCMYEILSECAWRFYT